MTKATKTRLIKEYERITGGKISRAAMLLLGRYGQSNDFYEWERADDLEAGYRLVKIDPFGFGVPSLNTNFGPGADPKEALYEPTPMDVPKNPQGDLIDNVPIPIMHLRILKEILPDREKDTLHINHDKGDSESTKNLLEGFRMDRLIECYAEGMEDEVICSYLEIRPSQLKAWIAASPQRMSMIQRLQDIMRSKDVNRIIDETLDYKIGDVLDKADQALESLKLDAMKFKSKAALDLDSRARVKQENDRPSLPVVNLGLQINVDNSTVKGNLDQVTPVMPQFIAGGDD